MNYPNSGPSPAPSPKHRDFFSLTGVSFPPSHAQQLLPFPIPTLDRDSASGMYITLALAERHPVALVNAMHDRAAAHMREFVQHVDAARRGDLIAARRGIAMVSAPEATELRYGYTRSGSEGSGVGDGWIAEYIVEQLVRTPELAAVSTYAPDVLALLPRIALDRMSDLIACITKDLVVANTQAVAKRFFPHAECVRSVQISGYWDPQEKRVVHRTFSLPVADDGYGILLPHKHIVRSSPPLRAAQFAWFVGASKMCKEEVLEYINRHPGTLQRFVAEIFADEWRYRCRRAFRD